MDSATAQAAAAAYMEGYQQCLEDVMKDGVELAQRIAGDGGMEALMAEAYLDAGSAADGLCGSCRGRDLAVGLRSRYQQPRERVAGRPAEPAAIGWVIAQLAARLTALRSGSKDVEAGSSGATI